MGRVSHIVKFPGLGAWNCRNFKATRKSELGLIACKVSVALVITISNIAGCLAQTIDRKRKTADSCEDRVCRLRWQQVVPTSTEWESCGCLMSMCLSENLRSSFAIGKFVLIRVTYFLECIGILSRFLVKAQVPKYIHPDSCPSWQR